LYIDPNTGGQIFQILAVALGSIGAILMIFSRKIRETFAKLRRKSRNDEGEEPKE
jgi:undecaprenyl pyrophosphate phosphatase UppP